MLTQAERLAVRMGNLPFDAVRAAYIARARIETGRIADARVWMESTGFERVTAGKEDVATDDGREIVRVYGEAWAVGIDEHSRRLHAALVEEQARATAARATVVSPSAPESIASTACPQMIEGKPCGGSLNRRGVCPSCVTGKMGYRYRYTCESCGCDIVTREELR